jgi:hypothetical protein
MEHAAPRRYIFVQGEPCPSIRRAKMNTPNPLKNSATLAMIDPARARAAAQALVVLEQMYGYFSFQPMPLEDDRRLAA